VEGMDWVDLTHIRFRWRALWPWWRTFGFYKI